MLNGQTNQLKTDVCQWLIHIQYSFLFLLIHFLIINQFDQIISPRSRMLT